MRRKEKFSEGLIYHVFNKSISNFGIFQYDDSCYRFIQAIDFYNQEYQTKSLGIFLTKNKDFCPNIIIPKQNSIIKILSYCLMPDHYHLLLKIIKGDFSKYLGTVENSYSRFFNLKYNRKGPLWQGSFKAVRIKNNEQLLHVSRYIHINPTTSNLIAKPENWRYSSYKDFIENNEILENIKEISIRSTDTYKKFVENNVDYQKKLKQIKKFLID